MSAFPTLHTERLDLVEIRQTHLGDLYRLFRDEHVTRFYNLLPFKQEEDAQALLDWFRSRTASWLAIRWGITLKGSEELIGTLGFNNFTENHRASLGYDLRAEHWGCGYMPEALRAVIGFGFETLGVNRIEAEVMSGNVSSERVLTKLGFQKEGLLRQWMFWNEQHYDMTLFSLLRCEYILEAGFKHSPR